jgi:putative salt-induced outer membrane protein YdiY
MKLQIFSFLAVASATAAFLSADVVKTKDGATLTGKITKVDAGAVTLSTSYAGELTIKQSEVTSLQTDAPKAIRLTSGTRIDGTVTTSDTGSVAIAGSDGNITTDIPKIQQVWPVNARDPLVGAWSYEATLNIQGTSGNKDSLDTGASFTALLVNPKDALKFYAAYDRAVTAGQKSADQFKGGIDYSSQITATTQWFARDEGGYDRVMDERFYNIAAAGYGVDFVKTPVDTFLGRAGVAYRYTAYSSRLNPTISTMAGDLELVHTYNGPRFEISNDLTYVPAFKDFANYYVTQDSFFQVPLKDIVFKFRMGISNNYNSKPSPGFKRLDTLYYLRLVYDFGAR